MNFFEKVVASGEYWLKKFIESNVNSYSTLRNMKHIHSADYIFFLSQPGHAQNVSEIVSQIPKNKVLIVKNYHKSIDDGISSNINSIRWYGFDIKPLKPKILITPHVSFPREMALADTKIIHLIISLMPLENVYLEDAFDDSDYIAIATLYQMHSFVELANRRPNKMKGKYLLPIGYPKIDSIMKRKDTASSSLEHHKKVVLLAPTHRYSGNEKVALTNSEISFLIESILRLDYELIYRPHPASYNSDADFIEHIQNRYAQDTKFSLDNSIDYFKTYLDSDVMITDYSGTGLTFAWGFNKKTIFYTSKQHDFFGKDILFARNTTELENILRTTMNFQQENLSTNTYGSVLNPGSSSEVFLKYLNLIKIGELDADWIRL